jgi:7-carboxy-7-deazaguanine synthase
MTAYKLNDIYGSIQGEGTLTGVPMVLVRLQGCGVGCPFCDTKETWEADEITQAEMVEDALRDKYKWVTVGAVGIAAYVRYAYPSYKWIMITGGEPAEQDLGDLVHYLHMYGYKVALETSGTATGHMQADFDWVCVSPKIGMLGQKVVLPEVMNEADEIKHVVGRHIDLARLDELLQTCKLKNTVEICLQPMSQGQKATDLCIKTVTERGWRLSLQTHKYANLR